ncbi:beta-1,6-N-acetylglucosaminyltransferase [Sphingomonas fuzhouensis]|uniref:beta-1,6-N-acetylglucosaminyltransferase n=1 Tax=Sphingomonas fuzhouensis TaxID=3106033 RepID=UPI002AFFEA9F|nr:beta-1,6-N-acetylglucosaminyltransferase [Sphingomonas sp. SGZ-02]
MRLVYAILAHDAFDQLERLIHRLLANAPEDRVCLHIDAKVTPPTDFLAGLSDAIRARVTIVSPAIAVYWAHWSQTVAVARLLDAALAEPFDLVHVISGRDWPLCSRTQMVAAIAAAPPGACFMDIRDDDLAWRMNDWCFIDRHLRPRADPTPLSWRIAVARSRISGWGNRQMQRWRGPRPEPLGPWATGWTWWSLPMDAAAVVRDATSGLMASGRLRYTQASDEHIAPTALLAAGFGDRIVPSRRMVRFAPGEWSPKTLTRADLEARPSDAWFGRKFDQSVDPAFLDL